MSRSGYTDDCDDVLAAGRWRAQVNSAIRGKRGQRFLCELADAMDAMPEKVLIADALIDSDGCCCTLGVVCKARGIDVAGIDLDDADAIGDLIGIAHQLVQEIEFWNDEGSPGWNYDPEGNWVYAEESPQDRWKRMRKWVDDQIKKQPVGGI